MKKIPIWLPDEPKSGIFTYWTNLSANIDSEEIVFVTDQQGSLNRANDKEYISSSELIRRRSEFTIPMLNIGVSREYSKQLDYLKGIGGYVFFHQLYLQRLVRSFYLDYMDDAAGYRAYSIAECGDLGSVLSELSQLDGLEIGEYYLRTFAKQIACWSVGYCSSWTGAQSCLDGEVGSSPIKLPEFHYVRPVFQSTTAMLPPFKARRYSVRRPIRFGLLGHSSALKNPRFCVDFVRGLRERGVPATLVCVGGIAEQAKENVDAYEGLLEVINAPTIDKFTQALDSLDFNLHFRHPFGGEMSGTVCESLSRGVPSVGWSQDWFDDLPDRIKVGVGLRGAPAEAVQAFMTQIESDGVGAFVTKRRRAAYDYINSDEVQDGPLEDLQRIFKYIRERA